ncbi:hypothetical protein HY624_04045 [Candidatus Uhrbacteria bacterium]|nr:hypothetical protein [Candidatus Uhrbacteria bacterium]
MQISQQLVDAALKFANEQIEQYGLPAKLHLDLSIEKGREIARALHADENAVVVGLCLMDCKLGEAFHLNRRNEHVAMGIEASKKFLQPFNLDQDTIDLLLNCVAAHHGAVPFTSLEAEIVANADCYRFIHPIGVLHFIQILAKREALPHNEIIDTAEAKLEEKHAIMSLPYVKEQLEPYYQMFKKLFAAARMG